RVLRRTCNALCHVLDIPLSGVVSTTPFSSSLEEDLVVPAAGTATARASAGAAEEFLSGVARAAVEWLEVVAAVVFALINRVKFIVYDLIEIPNLSQKFDICLDVCS
ncbi:MAG: hypothetical protein ACKN9K_02080, partial [Dolichospermum sp.]